MTDNVENLVLEHLRAIRADVARIERKLEDRTQRLGRIELTLACMASAHGHHEEATPSRAFE
jgi:hypothetical protein